VIAGEAAKAEGEAMQVETDSAVAATNWKVEPCLSLEFLGTLPFSGNEDEDADGKEGDEVMGEPSEEAVEGKADDGPAAKRRKT